MTRPSRRDFGLMAAGAATALSLPLGKAAFAQASPKVVVIGGGAGGAAVAGRIKAAQPGFDVTLVEPKAAYTTCFYSNLYLGGFRSLKSLTFNYEGLKKRGINFIQNAASGIDTTARSVTLVNSSTKLTYDRLVVAPGIDIKYESIEGYSAEAAELMPHAWIGGPQTWTLKRRLLALTDGARVVMSVPPNPYRCPPGPYERACMIAHFLKSEKPKSKLIIFDAKPTFSKQALFEDAFTNLYGDVVELNLTNEIDDNAVVRVDAANGEVVTKGGRKERAQLANIIPAQKAGEIAHKAGLAEGDWCPVNVENFTSKKAPNVYVIGDAAISADMPKSAFSAMSHAGVVAADIVADLTGKPRGPGVYRNTCWSMLAPENSVKIGADYSPGAKDGKPILAAKDPFLSERSETAAVRSETFQESASWYQSATTELFGDGTAPLNKT